jgi:hypothetical protein
VRRAAALSLAALSLAALGVTGPARAADDRATVLVVVGAPGAPEYEARFAGAARRFADACAKAGARCVTIGSGAGAEDRRALERALGEEVKRPAGALWLVLVGHGTFDGRAAKFNLRGPDVEAAELAAWLAPAKRPVVVLNTASASGPFLKALAAPGRVVLTATKSGREVNATRLAEPLGAALADPAADLDKDGQTSLLEAYLVAAKRVGATFVEGGLLATEHALLDDNGDGLGTGAGLFQGLRVAKPPADGSPADGARAHRLHLVPSAPERALGAAARKRRDELEAEIGKLRASRGTIAEEQYYARLEKLLVEMARIYEGK